MGSAWRRASLLLDAAHGVFICGGNGATATGNGETGMIDQWHWGTGAGALGQEQQEQWQEEWGND
jgi:hypothetical protein